MRRAGACICERPPTTIPPARPRPRNRPTLTLSLSLSLPTHTSPVLVSDKAHALPTAVHDAKGPLAAKLLDTWQAINEAEWKKYNASGGGCDAAARKAADMLPLSFGIQGSGALLPFYQGVIQGLYNRGALTPEKAAKMHFGGLSGGGESGGRGGDEKGQGRHREMEWGTGSRVPVRRLGGAPSDFSLSLTPSSFLFSRLPSPPALTSILTALGFTGEEQYELQLKMLKAYGECGGACPQSLYDVILPILRKAILAKNDDPVAVLNGRVTIWACQVNAMTDTNKHSVAQGTSKWADVDDLINNFRASGSIPCATITPDPYTVFRGSAYIDGGYCANYAQLCPKTGEAALTKCLKLSTAFLGPNLAGTPPPTYANCPNGTVKPDYLPYPGKPYYTPANQALWAPRSAQCEEDVPFVPQGVSAKPDIMPFFYAPINTTIFPTGCDWQSKGLAFGGINLETLQAMFDQGVAEGQGWADQHGYCS